MEVIEEIKKTVRSDSVDHKRFLEGKHCIFCTSKQGVTFAVLFLDGNGPALNECLCHVEHIESCTYSQWNFVNTMQAQYKSTGKLSDIAAMKRIFIETGEVEGAAQIPISLIFDNDIDSDQIVKLWMTEIF